MIISPPFLPPKGTNTEDAWLDLAMQGLPGNKGSYPIAANGTWHGGVHLQAPSDGLAPLPVRAIADGIVVYVREPAEPNNEENHPLNYDGGQSASGWTSDGCVIIEHNTEIGAAPAEGVRFYSLYVHLQHIDNSIKQGRAIYRKDLIGKAGYVYGTPNILHFEIICDDLNITRLTGRSDGDLSLLNDGRTDAIFGEVYFYLPTGTPLYATPPILPTHSIPHPPEPQQIGLTQENLLVKLRYDAHGFVTSCKMDGTVIGNTLQENDAEYDLLSRVRGLRPSSPSVTYEVFRFGRVISSDTPAETNTHWRKIPYAAGFAWVDLASSSIKKFSDADFPHWCGWRLVDECLAGDNRVRSQDICMLLDSDHNGSVTGNERIASLAKPEIMKKLSRLICKFPNEWDAKSVDTRWNWIKKSGEDNHVQLEQADYERLRKHIVKLSFWDEASAHMHNMPATHWHFNPIEFIRHFRKCEWMSAKELAQCLPRRGLAGTLSWGNALARANEHKVPINFMIRKFIGNKKSRLIHILAQTYHETGLLNLMNEDGNGAGKPYGPFFGRGYMQLTWPTNYASYGDFKNIPNISGAHYKDRRITQTSTHLWSSGGNAQCWFPKFDPDLISEKSHSAESGGYFWISKHFRGTKNINRACDLGTSPTIVAFVSWLINGGQNGHNSRQQYAAFLANVLLDEVPKRGAVPLRYPPLSNSTLCSHFPPVEIPYTQTLEVFYDRQVP